jgi:excisionase family DNA binding protein
MDRMLLTREETAKLLSIGLTKLRDLVRRGELPAVYIGTAVRFSRAEVEAWVEKRSTLQ